VPDTVIRDLQVTTVTQEARRCSVNYCKRLDVRPNRLANTLFLEQLVARRLNPLALSDPYMGRTAQLTSRRCILNIYSTNIRTEYFKCAA
jgi:hypothetical protein